MLVRAEVKISGSREFTLHQFHSLVMRLNIFSTNYFEIQLDETQIEGDNPAVLHEASKLIGKKVSIKFSPQDQNPELYLKGIITKVSNHNLPDQSILIISGESPDVVMNYGKRKKVFNNMNTKDIVKKISALYPADAVSIDVNTNHPLANLQTTFLQYNETDYQFIRRLANSTGAWFFHDGIQGFFGKPKDGSTVELINGINLNYFDIDTKAGGISYEARSYFPTRDEELSGKVNPGSQSIGSDNVLSSVVGETKNTFNNSNEVYAAGFMQNSQQINDYVQTQYKQDVAELVSVSGSSIVTTLKLGSKIKVKRPNGASLETVGEYRIVSLTISISGDYNYSNNFTAIAYSDYAPANPALFEHNIPATMLGVVTDVNDPDKHGKVKVRFDWQKSEDFYDWIQVLSPNAGNDSGLFFRPEVNERVLVSVKSFVGSFESFVIGAFHHGRATPDRWFRHRDNQNKGFRTKAGNEILLEDKGNDGKAISIQTSDDDMNYLWLVDNNGTTEIYLRSKSIKLMAENDLEISAGGKLKLQGTDVTISSGKTSVSKDSASQGSSMALVELKNTGDVNVKSQTKVEINANTDIKLNAMANVNISATANFDISANGKLSIAGASSSLQGKVDVSIQGAMVRIN